MDSSQNRTLNWFRQKPKSKDAAGQVAPASHTDTITPSEQQNLQELVDAKCKGVTDQGKARAEVWSRLHHKFRIAKYSQLPRTQLTEAQLYIMSMELKSAKQPMQPQAAREVLSGRDMAALTRVVWFIARGMGRETTWTQGIWYHLRAALDNPAPNPWYVDQLPDIAVNLRRLLIETEAVRTLVNRIEVEAVRRLLRRGESAERVLLDMQRLAEKEMDAVGRQIDELPSWLGSDIKAICDRSMSVYNGHQSSGEQLWGILTN